MPQLVSAPEADVSDEADISAINTTDTGIRRSQRSKKNVNYDAKLHPDYDQALRPALFARRTGRQPPPRPRGYSTSSEVSADTAVSSSSSRTYASPSSSPSQEQVQEPKERRADPKATRRSSRPQALKYHNYNTKVHPQDAYLPNRRGKKRTRESLSLQGTSGTATPTDTVHDVGGESVQASESPTKESLAQKMATKRPRQARDSTETLADSAVSGLDSRRAGAKAVLSIHASPAGQDNTQDGEEEKEESEDEEDDGDDDKETAELDYDTATLDNLGATTQELLEAVDTAASAIPHQSSMHMKPDDLSNGTRNVEKPIESMETAPELPLDSSTLPALHIQKSSSDETLAPAIDIPPHPGSGIANNAAILQHLNALKALGIDVSSISGPDAATSTADSFARPDQSNDVAWTPASSLFTALNSTALSASSIQRSGPLSSVPDLGDEQDEQAQQHRQTAKRPLRHSQHAIPTDQDAPASSTSALISSQRHRYTGRPSGLGLKPQASIEVNDSEAEETFASALRLQVQNSTRGGQ